MAKFVHVPFDRAMGILAPLRPGKKRTMDRLNLADNATAEGHQTGTIRYNIHSKFDLLKVSTFLQSVTLLGWSRYVRMHTKTKFLIKLNLLRVTLGWSDLTSE